MAIIKRFIKEKIKLKYLFFFIILTFLFLTLLTTWSLFTSLSSFKYDNIKNNAPISTVELDLSSITEDEIDIESNEFILPTKEEYEKIAGLEEVTAYEINLLDLYLSPNLLDVSDEEYSDLGLFTVKGVNKSSIFDEKFNNIKITEGRMISNQEIKDGVNSVLISEEVAKRNNLKVGDDYLLQISNPHDIKETYEQEVGVVGVFKPNGKIGSEKIEGQNLSILLDDLLKHDHEHEEEHSGERDNDSEELKQTEFDNIISLQKMFLLENLNTIYMSNNTVETISKRVDKEFKSDTPSIDYQASYVLGSSDIQNEFNVKAEKILPDHFMIFGVSDAYNSWMPNTSKNLFIMGLLVIFLLIIFIIILTLIIIIDSFKSKELLLKFLLLGKRFKDFRKVLLKKHLMLVSVAVFLSMFFAPMLSKKIISEYLISSNPSSGMYFNIQYLSRNLIDPSMKLTEYATFNNDYIVGAIFIYTISILLIGSTTHFVKKRLLKGILV